ncbi:SRPBCC domain-containing protein [Chitinophaga sp. GCM10012297]|uniref:SRPBCC domain-containing protein n=1 Tax=Chitinophaga chungangae TaxID=2821488 RepID=A0ABS3YJQ6_9BACT|nr:SRPBCC domain-containing protein [Chitinophaga chungangae]MBO9154538.1 SRPBCC domain-containing protein [Chitinophaga chungangae]
MYSIDHIQYIRGHIGAVYEALTTEKGLGAVWTEKLVVKPEAGFVNEFDFNDNYDTKFKNIALAKPTHILWECVQSDPEWVGTTVSFDLEQRKDMVAVTLRHMGWRELTEFFRFCNYNWGQFLYSLKSYLETGKGQPYQQRQF